MRFNREKNKIQAMTLVELLIGIAIISIMAFMFTKFVSTSFLGAGKLSDQAERRSLRLIVSNAVSCVETRKVANCDGNKSIRIPIVGTNTKTLISSGMPYTVMNGYEVQAKCVAGGKASIEVRPKGQTTFTPLFNTSAPFPCEWDK